MASVIERIDDAARALATLTEVVAVSEPRPIERDAAIARFTYTFEAVWKSARAFLLDREGRDAASPKSAVRTSHKVGLLYHEDLAKQIFARLPGHAEILHAWLAAMRVNMSAG